MVRPLLFGYLRLRITDRPGRAAAAQRMIREFADREGYTLAQVYVEANENSQCAALAQLIHDVHRWNGAAVAVPDQDDLGLYVTARHQLRQRLLREAGVPVIVIAGPDPSH
jgi:DNA invertase Pin-like site-specific DNA recombinase